MRATRLALLAAILAANANHAAAGEEMLLRRPVDFTHCHQAIANMLIAIKADPQNILTEVHTGAIVRVKLVASEANLVFACSKSAGEIEVWRTTPGELPVTAGG